MKSIGVTFDEPLLERLDRQPEVRERGRSAVLRTAVADYLAARAPEAGAGPGADLSLDFLSRLLRFVEWEPGWDGESAEHIDHVTARRALEIARSMRAVAPEPFVAPAPSGSLLLQWDFGNGNYVDVFVDSDSSFPADAALVLDGVVHEVPLAEPAELRSLLTGQAALGSAAQ